VRGRKSRKQLNRQVVRRTIMETKARFGDPTARTKAKEGEYIKLLARKGGMGARPWIGSMNNTIKNTLQLASGIN